MSKQYKGAGFISTENIGLKELMLHYSKSFPDDLNIEDFWTEYGIITGGLSASLGSNFTSALITNFFCYVLKASAWTAVSKKGSFKVEQKRKLNLAKEVPLSNAREDDKDRDYMG